MLAGSVIARSHDALERRTGMSDVRQRHPITLKRFVYRLEGMEAAPVLRDVEYRRADEGSLTLDIYRPAEARAGGHPAVVIVGGYRDVGVPLTLGCVFKEMEMSISLAQLIAASGMAAVTYTTSRPAADLLALLDHLTANAPRLDLSGRLALWAMSGNVPVALAALMNRDRPPIAAAILSQGFTIDLEGTGVADAARAYGFVDATAGMSAADLPVDVPLFVARAGRDEFAGLNEALDRFVSAALARNVPLSLVNHHTAAHAFEIHEDSDTSRHITAQMLAFMQRCLKD
jgi:hypothetical protein